MVPPAARRRRFPWPVYLVLFILICLIGIAPFAIAMSAGYYAEAHGCILHEGFVNPCVIDGTDHGQLLYGLGVLGWLGLITIPAAIVALGIELIALIVHVLIHLRANRAEEERQ